MGISRDSLHKRRLTGGKKPKYHKKRKFEMGRQMAMTKIGQKRIRTVRCRGGNLKFRALRLDTGNFSWGSEVCTRKTRVLDVVYNASNNELVRTKTLVKGAIVQIDATPFRQWYEAHYGVSVGRKNKKGKEDEKAEEPKTQSKSVLAKIAKRQESRSLDTNLNSQFDTGRLLACISSRPGQCGRCDGYVLEGKELEFYVKRMARKKK
jgi:small subunit ribosomal protein S8e